jgi:hypothetical protein
LIVLYILIYQITYIKSQVSRLKNMAQLEQTNTNGYITFKSIADIQKHEELCATIVRMEKQLVECQAAIKSSLNFTLVDPDQRIQIINKYCKIQSIKNGFDDIGELYENYRKSSVSYLIAVTEAAIVYNMIMETINVRETNLMQTKSFWINRLSQFVMKKKGFDIWCKENADEYPSIFDQGKKSLRNEILELRQHFNWVAELEDFFTIF